MLAGCSPAPDHGGTQGRPTQPNATSPPATASPQTGKTADTGETDGPADCGGPCRGRPRVVGSFGLRAAPEASGLAAGPRNRGVLYVLDDGPGTTSLLAIGARDGALRARLEIAGLQGVDTESLASAPCGGNLTGHCLYIGDIGDNVAGRESITITRVREPSLRAHRDQVVDAEQVVWRYPDGPHDAEALLAAQDGTLAVVTKNPGRRGRGAARLYIAASFADTTLTRGSRVRLPPPSNPGASIVLGNVVTGGDAAPGRVVLRTYDAIYEFTAPRTGAPVRNFATWPVTQVPSPAEPQGEAISYGPDRCGLFTVSEGSGDVTSIPCR